MSDHGARALMLAALGLAVVGVLLWWLASRPTGIEELAAAAADKGPGDELVVAAHLDVRWETLHVFPPHTPPHLVEDAVGQRVSAVRALGRDGVLLLVLTDERGSVTASGLVARAPVDWLPLVDDQPYARHDAVFPVRETEAGTALHPR